MPAPTMPSLYRKGGVLGGAAIAVGNTLRHEPSTTGGTIPYLLGMALGGALIGYLIAYAAWLYQNRSH
jgi:hypothetical protein